MSETIDKDRCPMCNKLAMKLVPLYDHDQEHKLQMCCRICKRKIRNSEEIVKWEGK